MINERERERERDHVDGGVGPRNGGDGI
jgi:hypothetical protein